MATEDINAKKPSAIHTVRLRDRECKELLASLKQNADVARGADARQSPRFGYDADHIIVTITHPAGNTDTYLVVPRDISVGGLSFIHGQFVHAKSRCTAALPTMKGEWFRVGGQIVRCRHLRGMIHEVSVKFDERIDPLLFVRPTPDPAAAARAAGVVNRVGPPASAAPSAAEGPMRSRAGGTVLLIDDDAADRALFGGWLRQQSLTVLDAPDGATALTWLEGGKLLNLALLDLHDGLASGPELTRRMRTGGLKAPILTVVGDGSDAARAEALAAGCNAVLSRPCQQRTLVSAVDQLLMVESGVASALGTPATPGAPGPPPVSGGIAVARAGVAEFIQDLGPLLERMRMLVEGDDPVAAAVLCQELRRGADANGFPAMAQLAALALGRLQERKYNRDAAKKTILDLIGVANRLSGG